MLNVNDKDICLIQETLIKVGHTQNVFGYNLVSKESKLGAGCFMILIRNDLKYEIFNMKKITNNSLIECAGIKNKME